MRCPACAATEDRVVDTRPLDDGAAIRRRRECLSCGRRFTTYERVEVTFWVVKRSGDREPFDRDKVVAGLRAAAKNRPIGADELAALAASVEDTVRHRGQEITSQEIGIEVLDLLRVIDEIAYVRFASVYKGFAELGDFQREVHSLAKATEPKQHGHG